MARSVSPSDLITLPKLSAHGAISLAQSLTAATRDEDGKPLELSEPVKAALSDMNDDRAALQEATGAPPAEAAGIREADILEDNAVGAFVDVLRGWARLAGRISQGDVADRLLTRLFSDGLQFLNDKPIVEHAQVESRLQTIDNEDLDQDIAKLGALPLLTYLKDVHKVYGEVTGATKPVAPADSPEIRAKLDTLLDSIRHYTGAVVGSIVRKKPETQALADQLLLPLTTGKSTKPKTKGPGEPPGDKHKGEG
jgi:hypothetical protein